MTLSTARQRSTRRTAIVAASLAAHAGVLALLALPRLPVFQDRSNDEDALSVTLERPPSTRPRAAAGPAPRAPSALRPREPARIFPSAVAPLRIGEPSRVGTAVHPAPLPEGPRGDLRTALRGSGVGCANARAVGLNRRETERCEERWGEAARDAPVYANAPRSAEAAGQMARQAASQEAARAYREERPIAPGVDHRSRSGPGQAKEIPFVLGAQQDGLGRSVSPLGQTIKRLDDARKAEERRKRAARDSEMR